MPLRRYVCSVCRNRADGELEGWGLLCVDCADLVVERLFALDDALLAGGWENVLELNRRLPPLERDDPFRPEPLPLHRRR